MQRTLPRRLSTSEAPFISLNEGTVACMLPFICRHTVVQLELNANEA